jgi:hypothetical protein
MGVTVTGMNGWLEDLDTLPERADKAFPPIMAKAGFNIKDDWSARWSAMPHAHIPHLVTVRAFSYDVDPKTAPKYTVEVGVRAEREQARLASFIEFGTLTSHPHPAGLPALEAEAPRMAEYAEKVGADLLDKP